MTRKQRLYERAWRYGTKLARLAVFGIEVGQVAYEAGYRAAMKDAREAMKRYQSLQAHSSAHNPDALFGVREFLKPIR